MPILSEKMIAVLNSNHDGIPKELELMLSSLRMVLNEWPSLPLTTFNTPPCVWFLASLSVASVVPEFDEWKDFSSAMVLSSVVATSLKGPNVGLLQTRG
jgi:hypothetical protein